MRVANIIHYEGRSRNKLQNSVILLIFKIQKSELLVLYTKINSEYQP